MRPALQRLLARPPSSLSLRRSTILDPPSSTLPTGYLQWQNGGSRRPYAYVHAKSSIEIAARSDAGQVSSAAEYPKPNLDLSKPFRDLRDVDTSDYKALIEWLDEAQQRHLAKRRNKIEGVDAPNKAVVQEGWNALGNLLARDSTNVGAVWRFLKDHGDHSPLVSMIEYFSRLERYGPHGVSAPQNAGNVLASRVVTAGSQLEAVKRAVELTRGKSVELEAPVTEQSWIAHLLATRWVNLDISISTVHALGVETLGPLSLQAIALREPNAADLAKRIDSLQQQGISIGNSAYSRAMNSFARRGQQELLQNLLETDQHPASFDHPVLQRQLIRKHEAEGNWQQAKLLRAIQLVSTFDPVAEGFNVKLQEDAISHDLAAMIKTLETMRMRRIPVEMASVWRILKSVLRPRQKGHRPNLLNDSYDMKDTDLAISILKNIMVYGGYVPVKAWTEVTRRLGMVGRLDELYSISAWLADAYNPQKTTDTTGFANGATGAVDTLDSSHDFHPLRILFPDVRQRSIIEWSFIHGMGAFSSSIRDNLSTAQMVPQQQLKAKAIKRMMRGVYFLKQLAKRGVYIKESNVRRAVYERMVILYGRGVSSKVYNRAVKPYNPVKLPELVRAVEHAWGKQFWPDIAKLELQIQNERDWDVMLAQKEKVPPQITWNDDIPRLE